MPNATTRRPALNIPLIVLWVAAVAVAGLGFWLLVGGNAAQADFYNEQGDDYLEYLNLQTQSTIGGMLLAAGVVGVFIALATHARNRAGVVLAANAVAIDDESDFVAIETVEAPVELSKPADVEPATAEPETTETAGPDETPPRA